VFKYTLAQEKRLAKQGRTEEFNAEFYKTVERGVFKEITKEEMAAWDGQSTTSPWWRPSRRVPTP
jgi:hypothetical protein